MTVQEEAKTEVQDQEPEKKAKSLRVRVVDNAKDGRPAVNIKLPIGVVKWGMKMAQTFSPEMKDAKLDWDSITAMIEAGAEGKIVDVEDEGQNKTVEVWVE
jgi:hypothetical protein